MSQIIDFITESSIRFQGELRDSETGLYIVVSDDLDIPEEGERLYFKANAKTYSFKIDYTDIVGECYHVYLVTKSMLHSMDPYSDENLDLTQELDY